jgi:autotransporter-associated beta strand protein
MTSDGSHTPTFNATKTVGLDINNAANTFTVSQNLNQTTGGLTKAGDGTLTLTGTSSYTGTTTIQGGTLNVGNGTSGTLGTGALTFNTNGGTANFNEAAGSSQTMGALTFGGGAGTVKSTYGGSGTTTLTFASLAARTAGATGNFVSSGGVNGTDNIIKFTSAPAAGALIDKGYYFNGADFAAYDSGGFVRALAYGTDTNTSAVDTIASATHVKLTASPAGQNSISLLTLNLSGSGTSWTNNASQTLTLSNGGLIKSGGGSATISGGTGITTGGATEFVIRTDTASDSLDIQTPILSTSTAGLTKTGAGTLILSGTGNAYTGATTVDEGTLSLSGTLTGGGAITIKSGATFSETGTGIISGASSLTSSGTTTLAGVNTYTGATTVSGGTLTVSGSGTLGGGSAVLNLSGGKLDLGGTSQSVGAITISAAAASGNTIQNGTLTGAGALTVSHTIGNAIVSANLTRATLAQSGAGTLTLSGTNAFSGNIGANAGNMAITGTTTVDGGAVNNTGFISVLGGATVTVSSGGSLNILGSTGTKPGSFIGQNSSGTLTVDGGSFTVGGNNNFGIGNNNYGAVGTLNINSGTATITAANAGALNIIAMGRDNATGIINLNGGTLATGRQFVRDGSNGGKQGAGTAIFNFNGGTLKALANQTSGNGWFETATTTDNQVVTTTVKAGGAKIDTNGFDANINTVLAHDSGLGATLDGGLTKSGTGTLALGAANTYTGGTTVNAGTLSVGNNSALGTGGVTVNTGGTLLIQQGFNVSNAVTLAGGAYNKNIATSTAYAYVSTSSFAGGQANTTASLVAGTTGAARSLSTSFADTSAASNDGIRTSDVFNLSGTGTDSFTLQLQVAGITSDSILGWNNAGTWVNAVLGNSTSGALAGSYAMGWNTFLANNGGSFNGTTMLGAYGYDTTNNTVWAVLDHNSEFAVVTAVPEPSTFALMGFGVAALVFLRRRARSSSDSSS